MNEFKYISYPQEVTFGPGALNQLGDTVESSGWQRIMFCASHSMTTGGKVDKAASSLGGRHVTIFDHVQQHVQDFQVREVLSQVKENNVEAVVGIGGGSSIGMAKAVGHQAHLPIIAIPTTYAGSEMTPVYGITHNDENPPRKVTVSDPRIVPGVVIYDPDLTLDLPAGLTASTGINALAHCIEALYSIKRNPLSTAAATSGVGHIFNSLLHCYENGKDPEPRTEMLIGSYLAGFSLASVSMGLHHGLCHVLGGTATIPHGIANAIILPHAIRFNADVTAAQLIPAAEAMRLPVSSTNPISSIEAMAQTIFDLIRKMNLPQRLRDVGVDESDLPRLSELAFQNRTVQNNPKPVNDAKQLNDILREAW